MLLDRSLQSAGSRGGCRIMLTTLLVVSLCISALCIGMWATSQRDVENARALSQHAEPAVRGRNLEARQKAERERRVVGWVGVVAAACALLRD
jgi:hypothetical protein